MTETASGSYKQAFEQTQEMIQAGEFELALDQVSAILEVHPRDVKVTFLKGVVLRNLGRHEEAVALFQQLARATEGVATVHQELGFSLFALLRIQTFNAYHIEPNTHRAARKAHGAERKAKLAISRQLSAISWVGMRDKG